MGDANNFLDDEKLSVILIGVGSAAFVITIYHCLAVGWCNRYQPSPVHRQTGPGPTEIAVTPSSIENSAAQLMPAHKYQKDMGLVRGDEDVTCAVCLSEFEEGEELRTLPECLHSYHAPCIDMWLYSHSSCPMCRTDATPLRIFQSPDSADSEGVEAGMLRHVDVQ